MDPMGKEMVKVIKKKGCDIFGVVLFCDILSKTSHYFGDKTGGWSIQRRWHLVNHDCQHFLIHMPSSKLTWLTVKSPFVKGDTSSKNGCFSIFMVVSGL